MVASALVAAAFVSGDRGAPIPRHRRAGVVRRFRLGDPLLELFPRLVRGKTPSLHGAMDLLALYLDGLTRGVDLFLDASPRILKRVDNRLRHIRRDVFGGATHAQRAALMSRRVAAPDRGAINNATAAPSASPMRNGATPADSRSITTYGSSSNSS